MQGKINSGEKTHRFPKENMKNSYFSKLTLILEILSNIFS